MANSRRLIAPEGIQKPEEFEGFVSWGDVRRPEEDYLSTMLRFGGENLGQLLNLVDPAAMSGMMSMLTIPWLSKSKLASRFKLAGKRKLAPALRVEGKVYAGKPSHTTIYDALPKGSKAKSVEVGYVDEVGRFTGGEREAAQKAKPELIAPKGKRLRMVTPKLPEEVGRGYAIDYMDDTGRIVTAEGFYVGETPSFYAFKDVRGKPFTIFKPRIRKTNLSNIKSETRAIQRMAPEKGLDPHRTMTMQDSAEYLKVSKRHLGQLIKDKKIAVTKEGASYKIMKSELDRFMTGAKPAMTAPIEAGATSVEAVERVKEGKFLFYDTRTKKMRPTIQSVHGVDEPVGPHEVKLWLDNEGTITPLEFGSKVHPEAKTQAIKRAKEVSKPPPRGKGRKEAEEILEEIDADMEAIIDAHLGPDPAGKVGLSKSVIPKDAFVHGGPSETLEPYLSKGIDWHTPGESRGVKFVARLDHPIGYGGSQTAVGGFGPRTPASEAIDVATGGRLGVGRERSYKDPVAYILDRDIPVTTLDKQEAVLEFIDAHPKMEALRKRGRVPGTNRIEYTVEELNKVRKEIRPEIEKSIKGLKDLPKSHVAQSELIGTPEIGDQLATPEQIIGIVYDGPLTRIVKAFKATGRSVPVYGSDGSLRLSAERAKRILK